jgi:hypothetical protein
MIIIGLVKKHIIYITANKNFIYKKISKKFKDRWSVVSYKISIFLHAIIYLANEFLVLKFINYQYFPFLYLLDLSSIEL